MSKFLGMSLRSAREKAGLTQTDVASKLGVSKAAVGQWERGITEPATANLLRVCDLLRLDVTAVSGGLVKLNEIEPVVGEADPDDRAFSIEDRRPISGNPLVKHVKSVLSGKTISNIPILQVAPVPAGVSVSDMFGKKLEAGLVIWNDMIDMAPLPHWFSPNDHLFGIYMPHDRNSPRYKIGELIFFEKREGRIGDYMLFEFIGGAEAPGSSFAVFGRLKKKTIDMYVVEESNPLREYVVRQDDCFTCSRALLTHELFGK